MRKESDKFQRIRRFICSVLLALLLLVISQFSGATEVEAVDSLLDQQLIRSTPGELHITNSLNAMVNSTVSLDHEDAWLFFDNIKPSVVAKDYLQYIFVNGEAFADGGNGRLSIFAHGTVLIPHGSNYNPLSVYTEIGHQGDSLELGVFTYHNNLGNFEYAIRSIRLKRGYMATFATQSDGTGYSRVYIADNHDIELDTMPPELDATIAFIRVFRHEWVSKKGWCQTGGGASDGADLVNGTWFYSWSADQYSTDNQEYAVIKQNGGWPGWGEINNKANVSQLLGFNEPDRPDQSNMTMETALAAWPAFMNSGLRIGSPATSDAFNSWSLFEFIDRCDELNYRVDFVAVHAYWVKSPQQWYNDLRYIHERTGRPIWITEWNNGANWTNEWWPADSLQALQKQLNDITAILEVLDTAHFVERYSIYNWVESKRAMILGGQLTPAGEYYAANKSAIAFNRVNKVIPPRWNYTGPTLSYRYLTLSNKISLNWSNPDGGLSKGFRLEKKVNNESYEIIYESDDISITTYTDDLDSTNSGRISFRLSSKTVYGDYISSNEESYYQSLGNDTLQFGTLSIGNTDWTVCLFSEKLSKDPLLITGIPTFNNITALTHRINAATKTSFKFRYDTWTYLNDPELAKSEDISVIALPGGVYDFGGLQAVAEEVTGVAGEWISIAFKQAFETLPVVFCTQASNNNFFPTMPAMKNVTETGFELCLRCEETISSGSILTETVNFLAIEPGQGVFGRNRISVGQTGENEEGISADPVVLSYNMSYSQPALFAGMQTSADDFASTLRFYSSGDHEFTVLKQREMSGPIQALKEDKLGWMVMDFAPDQPVSVKPGIRTGECDMYPNPVEGYIRFNFQEPTPVRIFDMAGRMLVSGKIQNCLDVSMLPEGIYMLKAGSYQARKFIKH